MAERLKRINYSIYLDPLNNPADLYASKVLHQWADDFSRLKAESAEENGLALLNARSVQKQVYLSGLFLHLLSPELSQQLSLQVTEAQVSASTLERTLYGLGLLAEDSGSGDSLQEQHDLLENIKASIVGHIQAEASNTREQLSSQTQQIQQAELLKRVEGQAQEIAELKRLLTAQTELIRKLPSGEAMAQRGQSTQEQDETPVVDLNERLAHVQKIKKKGIF
ncbi:hypothetical protein [Photobacterium satsumensis]|uniref:hypothetical protein n=1 Tax=Photobacterium satsumensis TaxID=2910239 RepID=UPI003D0AB230